VAMFGDWSGRHPLCRTQQICPRAISPCICMVWDWLCLRSLLCQFRRPGHAAHGVFRTIQSDSRPTAFLICFCFADSIRIQRWIASDFPAIRFSPSHDAQCMPPDVVTEPTFPGSSFAWMTSKTLLLATLCFSIRRPPSSGCLLIVPCASLSPHPFLYLHAESSGCAHTRWWSLF
jgi:hypothetical protein